MPFISYDVPVLSIKIEFKPLCPNCGFYKKKNIPMLMLTQSGVQPLAYTCQCPQCGGIWDIGKCYGKSEILGVTQ